MSAIFEVGPTTVVQMVNFGVLLGVLKFLLYDPLSKAVKDRQEAIANQLDEAESINAQAKALKENYQEKFNRVKDEAAAYYQKMLTEAEAIKAERLKALEAELTKLREKSEQDLKLQKAKAFDALKQEVGDLAIAMTEKLLKGVLQPEQQQQMLKELIKQMEVES